MHETEITMPKLSMTMEEGDVVGWDVAEGAVVAPGDVVCRVMTDKTEMDVEATAAGRLVRVVAKEGETVTVGGVLAIVATEDRDLLGGLFDDASPSGADSPPADDPVVSASVAPTSQAPMGQSPAPPARAGEEPQIRVFAGVASVPAARSLARRLEIDIEGVPASGLGGLVTIDDVLAAARPSGRLTTGSRAEPEPAGGPHPTPADSRTDEPALRGRAAAVARTTAKVMTESATIPQFTLYRELDIDYANQRRNRIGWTTIFAAASAAALRSCPRLNGSWTGRDVIVHDRIVLAIAVDTDDGLVAPTIADPDQWALSSLDGAISELIERARSSALQPEDQLPATFTLSNLGPFGVDWFQALVTPPQAAVLSLGAVKRTIEATEDGLRMRRTCRAGLSVDHRAANGADGARFLNALNESLQAERFVELALGVGAVR